MSFSRILVRAANWVGDAVMSLPALRAIRARFPQAEISVLARPWVADLYARERFADRVIAYTAGPGAGDWAGRWKAARELRRLRFEAAILLPNSFDAALVAWLAGIRRRIGYNHDGRWWLLTDPVPRPRPGEIPVHESFYYLELLRRAGLLDNLPAAPEVRLDAREDAAAAGERRFEAAGLARGVIGVSPGAAFGGAKRWFPERFAAAAARVARTTGDCVAIFGSAAEHELCATVARSVEAAGVPVRNFAGETSLGEFIELAAACRVFLTNDSGAMHIASALGVPTVAVFGATDHRATGPAGAWSRVVCEPVDCAPCKLRECPIDHRCMERVSSERVAETALELLK